MEEKQIKETIELIINRNNCYEIIKDNFLYTLQEAMVLTCRSRNFLMTRWEQGFIAPEIDSNGDLLYKGKDLKKIIARDVLKSDSRKVQSYEDYKNGKTKNTGSWKNILKNLFA